MQLSSVLQELPKANYIALLTTLLQQLSIYPAPTRELVIVKFFDMQEKDLCLYKEIWGNYLKNTCSINCRSYWTNFVEFKIVLYNTINSNLWDTYFCTIVLIAATYYYSQGCLVQSTLQSLMLSEPLPSLPLRHPLHPWIPQVLLRSLLQAVDPVFHVLILFSA